MICIRIRSSCSSQEPEPGAGDLQRNPLPEISSQGGRDPEQLQRVSFQKPNGTERNREKPKGTGARCRRSAAGAIFCSHRRGIRASGRQNGQTDGQTATGGRNRANLAESGQRQRDPLPGSGAAAAARNREQLQQLSTNHQPTIH